MIGIAAHDPEALVVIHGLRGKEGGNSTVQALDSYASQRMGKGRVLRQPYILGEDWLAEKLEKKLDKSRRIRVAGCGENLAVCVDKAVQMLAGFCGNPQFKGSSLFW